jgi:hypothetical protein
MNDVEQRSGLEELADEIIELGKNRRQLRVEKVVNVVARIVLHNS